MTSAQQASPWRGYINQLTYGMNLAQRVDDDVVRHLADSLIEQRSFGRPVEQYYEAVTAALASRERLAEDDDQDEVLQDFLVRLVRELDERHPWQAPPFRALDNNHWPDVGTAPVIGHIPLSRMSVGERLSAVFRPVQGGTGEPFDALVLGLRSGEIVGLAAPASFTERGVSVRAHGDPSSVMASIRELTGLPVEAD